MTKPTLNEIRDKALNTTRNNRLYNTGYCSGFDAGVAEMKKRVQVLENEMELSLKYLVSVYNHSDEPEHAMILCFKKALEEYRKSME